MSDLALWAAKRRNQYREVILVEVVEHEKEAVASAEVQKVCRHKILVLNESYLTPYPGPGEAWRMTVRTQERP